MKLLVINYTVHTCLSAAIRAVCVTGSNLRIDNQKTTSYSSSRLEHISYQSRGYDFIICT